MDVKRYRQQLLAIERDLEARLGRDASTARESVPDQSDTGDVALADEIREEYFALADTDTAILAQVRAALRRIDEGTYGLCLVDDEPIPTQRLDAIPWTPYCVAHQLQVEARTRVRTPRL